METLIANIAGRVRRETLDGRDYLVAHATLIVPGVLAGSKGPLYYPASEVARDEGAWNGFPLVLGHPTFNGFHVSARSPKIIEKYGIGFVFNDHFAGGKRRAEAWFDVEKTRRVDGRVLDSLERGQPIELSTGLFTDNEQAPAGSHHNGKSYSFIARNYKPDHLAILPDQVGACSILDGCGVLVNKLSTLVVNCDCEDPDECECKKKEEVSNGWQPLLNSQPSDKADVTPEKACKILKDGTAQGHPLTAAQRGMFGAICEKRDKPTGNRRRCGQIGGESYFPPIPNEWQPIENTWAGCKRDEKGHCTKGDGGSGGSTAQIKSTLTGGKPGGPSDAPTLGKAAAGIAKTILGKVGGWLAAGGTEYAKNMGTELHGAFIKPALNVVHPDAVEEYKSTFRKMFAVSTLGTGPLAVAAAKAGIKYSPKGFKLLMAGARGVHEAVKGAKASPAANRMSEWFSVNAVPDSGVDEVKLKESLAKLQELSDFLKENPDELKNLLKACKAALKASSGGDHSGDPTENVDQHWQPVHSN